MRSADSLTVSISQPSPRTAHGAGAAVRDGVIFRKGQGLVAVGAVVQRDGVDQGRSIVPMDLGGHPIQPLGRWPS